MKIRRSKTFKNKLYAVGLILLGCIPVWVFKDWSGVIIVSMVAVPLYFEKENHIY